MDPQADLPTGHTYTHVVRNKYSTNILSYRSVENLHQMNPSQHRPSCGGFSLCGGIPPVICHETSHLLQTSSAAAGPAVSLPCAPGEQLRHGPHSHSSDGKRRISTCSGYSTATGNSPKFKAGREELEEMNKTMLEKQIGYSPQKNLIEYTQ